MGQVTVEVTGDMVDANEEAAEGYDDWELDDACRTLAKAEEIKADAALMAAIKPLLEKKAKAYKSLAQLKQMGAAAATAGK